MSAPTEPLWKLENVSLSPQRLRDVSLEVRPGATAVLGLSGAGKTSLLNLLVGFEKPSAGKILGTPRCGWVPPGGGLWSHCTVSEHLAAAGVTGTDDLLEKFDLVALAANRPHQLSQGESSRLAVARTLATKANVLVMDEPLAHVDHARVGKYWSAIRETVEAGTSLVFSTHTSEHVLGMAQYAICMHEGAVVFHGEVATLYHRPPSPVLMQFLGQGNWFTPDEQQCWLGNRTHEPLCLRPEAIGISQDANGEFTVISSRFLGSHAETELQGEDSIRVFYHRPPAPLPAGSRVRIADISGNSLASETQAVKTMRPL